MKTAPSNPNRLRLIKLIHVARRELHMDADTYRLMLAGMKGLDGATSTADLSVPNLLRVLEQLKQKGFKVRPNKAGKRPLADDDQSKKIRSLWLALHDLGEVRDSSEAALAKFVLSMTRVSALQWLSTAQASRVIENLKQWQYRVTNKEVV
ncbi:MULTISPECIES: gp16 family protein [Pseudomonas]|uniref:gp16 family protein n=1 Tax=Pseudomonas TaxID=286 RepID=UPI0006D47014|nr:MULTISPECIES: regulatory protein GemA [Pseudomonas]MCP9731834.1 regulatory protein GemA [Pseudomonas sp. GBPI_506]MBA1271229.1 regulatory protein GemA [Pseudomonas carnis]MBV2081484.1 regulatory protein GemA [Pseudomonas carnis]MBV2087529.1 regulatory protein GemA [Pseudomonas carnis]MDO3691295.1 regulatory protein GemA [Pseudomonas sp. DKN 2791]